MHRPLAAILLVFLAVPVVAESDSAPLPLRLPSGIRPLGYQATLDITPGQDSFRGVVQISLLFDKPSSDVTLHAKELALQSERPAAVDTERLPNDLVRLHFAKPFPAGAAKLTINYTGAISRVLTDGAFQQQHAGDWYVFTKFEPITARRVFPCFDEPGFKVPWQLTLNIPNQLKAFSNTPIQAESTPAEGRKLVKFKQTRALPSYLVAFAVGPFDVIETPPVGRNHTPSRVVVPRGRVNEANYALSVTPRLIEMLESYFGTPYPYEKLDQVVVPLTTSWGAMENAGMIAYGDFFLAPANQDSERRHQQLALTMEHEMAHQWFGDLVSIEWWNDIWLNEAFASWISDKLVAGWHPEWRITEKHAASPGIFEADSLSSARKIRQPIESAGDIGTAFDGITYIKGQAVIAMFEHYLGESMFAGGVREYLKVHAWKNATSDDLLHALDEVAPKSGVGVAFASFLNQVGFPEVTFNLDCTDSPRLLLDQHHFIPLGSTTTEETIWSVPVCVAWQSGTKCFLLNSPKQSFELGSKACPTWLFANSGAAGYYISRPKDDYPVGEALAHLSAAERAAYLRDIRVLFSAGRGNLEGELKTAASFSNSDDPNLVQASASTLESVADLVPDRLRRAYADRIRALFYQEARQLGWTPGPKDSAEIRALRGELLPLIATFGGANDLGTQARDLAEMWLRDRGTLQAEIVPDVLFAAAWSGGRELFDAMSEALKTTKIQRERAWIIHGMSGFRDPSIAQSALALIGVDGIDSRETAALLFSANFDTRETVWRYVTEHSDQLNATLPSARGVPFAVRLPEAALGFCDYEHATETENFFKSRIGDMPGGQRSLSRAVERIRLCAAQAELAKPAIAAYLQP